MARQQQERRERLMLARPIPKMIFGDRRNCAGENRELERKEERAQRREKRGEKEGENKKKNIVLPQ
jgi:hypothetical protein